MLIIQITTFAILFAISECYPSAYIPNTASHIEENDLNSPDDTHLHNEGNRNFYQFLSFADNVPTNDPRQQVQKWENNQIWAPTANPQIADPKLVGTGHPYTGLFSNGLQTAVSFMDYYLPGVSAVANTVVSFFSDAASDANPAQSETFFPIFGAEYQNYLGNQRMADADIMSENDGTADRTGVRRAFEEKEAGDEGARRMFGPIENMT